MSNDNNDNHHHNNNNNISDGKMKVWRLLAVLNVILGGTVLIIQIATLSSLYDWVDWVGIGIWGGCFMISAGSLTLQRSPRLMSMSVLALLSCLALVIFYSVNLGYIDRTYYCNSYYESHSESHYDAGLCDWRLAADIIFVVSGCIGAAINCVLTANASSIIVIRPTVRYQARVANAYPMTATNTTYVVSSTTAYPTNQTVYQVPVASYPVYQTTPVGYYPNNQVQQPQQQQQQQVYYQQPPPPYPTSTNY